MWFSGDAVRWQKRGAAALVASACFLAGLPLLAQHPARVDSSRPLFVVMAAINAAGYDAGLSSPHASPVRLRVRQRVAAAKPPSLEALRAFYVARRHPDPALDLSQFISFALLIGGPPDFPFRVQEPELPPEVSALRDLRPLLAAFYQEANLEALWEQYRPAYEQELDRYNEGLGYLMLELNGYLRIASSGFLGRDFWVHVDLLGAPGQANARGFGRDYYVVVSTAPELKLKEIRHGLLHYLLEPLALKHRSLVRTKSDLQWFAEAAHGLQPALRKDFRLLLSESLIRALELRLAQDTPAAKQQRLGEILEKGHFLAPYFYEALEKFEQQEAGIRIYYPEMLEKLDVGHERKRLAGVQFREATEADGLGHLRLPSLPVAGPVAGATVSTPSASEEETVLAQAEDAMARQDFAQARRLFRAALEKNGALQARALYGLALVATQERQPELARSYFERTLEVSKDPHLLAWSHIYLGRIYDMKQERALAVEHYRQALETQDAEAATRRAAELGLEAPFRRETLREQGGDSGKKNGSC